MLGRTFQANALYETPDGQPITIDMDLLGKARDKAHPTPGPLERYEEHMLIWTWDADKRA